MKILRCRGKHIALLGNVSTDLLTIATSHTQVGMDRRKEEEEEESQRLFQVVYGPTDVRFLRPLRFSCAIFALHPTDLPDPTAAPHSSVGYKTSHTWAKPR